LITVRGLSLLREADVVIYDRLVGAELLAELRADAERIDVGKTPGSHHQLQEQINSLLIDRARAGRAVVRLKGGDPFIFGRGFEELEACRHATIPCVVIPGVTSALAGPEAAGIPITHRGLVRTLAIVAGRTAAEHDQEAPDYAALARMDTIVVLMGRANIREYCREFVAAGLNPDTPAACVARATTARQQVVLSGVSTLADVVERAGLESPVVVVIGRVAAFAAQTDVAAFWSQAQFER
jgi:uroporphyrin-III C-methyltransferase